MRRNRLNAIVSLVACCMALAAVSRASAQQPRRDAPPPPVDTNRGFGVLNAEALSGLSAIGIEGPSQQVEQIIKIIESLDMISGGAEPDIRVVRLKHADSESLVRLLTTIYTARDASRPGAPAAGQQAASNFRGKVGFVALAQPNAVIVVGQKTEIQDVVDFVEELDVENKDGGPQFHVFQLKNAPAADVQAKLQQYFALGQPGGDAASGQRTPAGLRARVEVIADVRTNSLFVFAGPQDLETAAKLIEQFDGVQPGSISILRVFPLKNSIASELANLLQSAIISRSQATGASTGAGQTQGQAVGAPIGQQNILPPTAQQPQRGQTQSASAAMSGGMKSSRLRFFAPDEKTGKLVESGILEDITISADDRTNSLLVTAPPATMELMAELIAQFDRLPSPTAQLKVYKLQNADAQAMLTTLQQVFLGQAANTAGGFQQGGFNQALNRQSNVSFAVGGAEPAVSLVPLNFSIDVRTNSIIVSGAENDILAVEALLIKLDSNTERERKTIVYRLKSLSATDATNAVDSFLQQQAGSQNLQQLGQAGQALALTLQQQIRNEVSVVGEPTTNVLIVSSTPRFFDEVVRIIEEIDTRPPQVLIRVLIADVLLTDDEEFGIEFGVQADSLFDRSVALTNGAPPLVPGFNFNSTQPLPSALAPNNNPDMVGMQGLQNLGLGRGSARNTFGGLIFSASSENISVLLRALKRQQRVDILSRPSVTALDNQQAFIQVGQSVPTVSNSQIAQNGSTINSVEYRDVGIILQVTPRINPDGTVIMRVQPQVSAINPVGQPLTTNLDGTVVATAPIIDITQAETTVTAMNGQTVVIGGLIRKDRSTDKRKIPWLGDLPIVGVLGRTQFKFAVKRELLIILTPEIIYSDCDMQRIRDEEARRIGWNLADVEKIQGNIGLSDYGRSYIGPSAMFKAKPQKSAPDPAQRPLNHSEKRQQRLDEDGNPIPLDEWPIDLKSQTAPEAGMHSPATGEAPSQRTIPGQPIPIAPPPRPNMAPQSGIQANPGPGPAPNQSMPTANRMNESPGRGNLSSDIVVLTTPENRSGSNRAQQHPPVYVQASFENQNSSEPQTGVLGRLFGTKSKETKK